MLTVFFGSRGVVHHEYAPQDQKINKEYYLEVLHRLHNVVRCKSPDLWAAGTWQLHHDNAPAHSSQPIQTFLAKQHFCGLTGSLLSRHGCLRFLAVPPPERSWKGLDLSHDTILFGTQRPSCIPFAKRHSRNASNNGGTAGRSVFSHRETTSNGIRVADLQACKCIFPGQRSDTFWTGDVLSAGTVSFYLYITCKGLISCTVMWRHMFVCLQDIYHCSVSAERILLFIILCRFVWFVSLSV